ncbi:MAG: protein kinase domain-containing protein [Gemmatimonadota bacterium]
MPSATRSCPACATPLPDEAQFCLRCGIPTPTDPGVPPRTGVTGAFEVSQVRKALADRYRIERILGEGGMATVYLAEDLKHRRKVAVKVMRPELSATLGADRFLREIEIAAKLSHPHILPVYDSGEVSQPGSASRGPSTLLYYVMPHVEGGTLRDRLLRDTQLPVNEALRLTREVAEALAYGHARGIIHRDIKPANILLGAGHALVADFGIARAIGAEGEALTGTGLAVGTPNYMSPEQASGDREVDGRADIYATGSVLYEMLAGEPPFTGPSARAIIMRSMTERPRSITATREEIAPQVEAVVMKTLAKNPADRFQTADELVAALDTASEAARTPLGTPAVPATAEAPPGVTSPRRAWTTFAGGSVIAMGVIYAAIRQQGLPAWGMVLAILLLAIGAGVMWMTTRMEARRQTGATTSGVASLFTWRNTAAGGFLALGLWTVLATAFMLRGPADAGDDGILRLAVLPFENRGGEADAYFVDGVTDEVRGKLTRLPGFEVIARTSSDQYRETTKSPAEIADELGVDYLLTGTVSWMRTPGAPDRVQVAPELVNVRTGAATWKQRFDTELTDVLKVQSSIASEVASALGLALGGADQERLADSPTENLAAYDLYLKGRAIQSRDPVTQRQAASYFEQAVALDDRFADGWAALAEATAIVFANGQRDRSNANRAREAADRAMALDPSGTAGRIALFDYLTLVENNSEAAASHIEEAMEIAPNDVEVLRRASRIASDRNDSERALGLLDRARALDPRSASVAQSRLFTLVRHGRYRDALAAGDAVFELTPTDLQSVQFHAMAYLALGDLDKARAVVRRALGVIPPPLLVAQFAGFFEMSWMLEPSEQQLLFRLNPAAFDNDRAWWSQSLATAHWDAGERGRARAYADSGLAASYAQVQDSPDGGQTNSLYGLLLAYLGRHDEAIEYGRTGLRASIQRGDAPQAVYAHILLARIHLIFGELDAAAAALDEVAANPHQYTAAWMRLDPMFRPLRGHARFESMLKRMES